MSLFDRRKKSPHACGSCRFLVHFSAHQDIAECPRCHAEFATGNEQELRNLIEKNVKGSMDYPPFAVGRAIGYASAIYGMATHDEAFDPVKLENHLRGMGGRFHGGSTGAAELVNDGFEGRGLRRRKLNDQRTGYMIVLVKGDRAARANNNDFVHIYVVFRGSRSDTGSLNPEGAGFTEGGKNVDYAVNFTGRQDPTWWAPEAIKVRRGHLELYKSMSTDICLELRRLLIIHPTARVIVTGHSLGAGLAVICAHHLHYQLSQVIQDGPFCLPFCAPKVGNLAFCRDFKAQIGDSTNTMPGEASGQKPYSRAINFSMHNDPVSTNGNFGFQRDRTDDPNSQGTPAANRSMLGKIHYSMKKAENKLIIFYQTPNVYDVGRYAPWNIHQYSAMQELFLGRVLYRT